MFFVVFLIIMLVVTAAMYASMPRPKGVTPQNLTESDVPTAQDGRDLCVLFGEGWVDDNNVINFGALSTSPIPSNGGK